MPTQDAAPHPPSRNPAWVRIPAWVSGITAIVSVVLLALAIAWPLILRGSDAAPVWIAVLVAYAVMIVSWIVWAILFTVTRRR